MQRLAGRRLRRPGSVIGSEVEFDFVIGFVFQPPVDMRSEGQFIELTAKESC
jgi:hypothetical protein